MTEITRDRFRHYSPRDRQGGVHSAKAVKSDKAAVPKHIWSDRLAFLLGQDELTPHQKLVINQFRKLLHKKWVSTVSQSWDSWWESHKDTVMRNIPGHADDIKEAGLRVVQHAGDSDFWRWPLGSAVFF